MTQIPRRRANQLGDLMGVLEFRAVHLNDGTGLAEQNLSSRFHDARLSRSCRPQEQQIADRAAWRIQSGAKDLVQVDEGLHTFFLANNLGAQSGLKFQRIRTALAWIEWKYMVRHDCLLTPSQLRRRCTKSTSSVVKLREFNLERGLQEPELNEELSSHHR